MLHDIMFGRRKMQATNLQLYWRSAANPRGLSIRENYRIGFDDGSELVAEVLLEGYGAPRGMIIVSDYTTISTLTTAITAGGYGYSCMSHSRTEIEEVAGLDDVLLDWSANEE